MLSDILKNKSETKNSYHQTLEGLALKKDHIAFYFHRVKLIFVKGYP